MLFTIAVILLVLWLLGMVSGYTVGNFIYVLLVIALLDNRVLRFTELKKTIDGISQRMLTVTLRQLERDGLVRRTVHPVVPPRVDYELTPLGASLLAAIEPLVGWARTHRDEIASARDRCDVSA